MTQRYTKEHEWVRAEATEAYVGISVHAQEQLGDIVYVELPSIGRKVEAGDAVAVVESVKAASEVYAPLAGEITAINADLGGAPELVNQDPEGKGWFFSMKLADPRALETLMDADAYRAYLKE